MRMRVTCAQFLFCFIFYCFHAFSQTHQKNESFLFSTRFFYTHPPSPHSFDPQSFQSIMRLRSGKVIELVPAYMEPQQPPQSPFSNSTDKSDCECDCDDGCDKETAPFLQAIESDCTKFDPSEKRRHHHRLVEAQKATSASSPPRQRWHHVSLSQHSSSNNTDLACYSPRKMKCGHLCCLEFTSDCCKCSDRRPTSQRAQKYVDGHGMVTLKRISADGYCPVCKKLSTRSGGSRRLG